MGMFDEIKCEVPLPDGWSGLMQTKDFECDMSLHTITADGRLVLEILERYEDVPKEQRPHPHADDDSLLGLCGCLKRITSQKESDFHGVITMYGSEEIGTDDKGYPRYKSHRYRAKFTDGRLVEIVLA